MTMMNNFFCMKVIIAEKPSVAREIANTVGATLNRKEWYEGGGYAVTWCYGHLLELKVEEAEGKWKKEALPLLPEKFGLQPIPGTQRPGQAPRLDVIRDLFNRCDGIVVATDAGREGELIFRNLYKYLGCTKPFKRLWISSLTESAIREGMGNLRDGHDFDALAAAAEQRSYADWLVGINATRAFTLAVGSSKMVLSLGRVQTVILNMICARYVENKNFKSEPFWFLEGESVKDGLSFKWRGTGRYDSIEPGQRDKNAVSGAGRITVDNVETNRTTEAPPLPHDITSLQKAANTRYGYTAEETLNSAQALYEAKLITYPRTGSRYIPEDVFKTIPNLLKSLGGMPEYAPALEVLRKGPLNHRCVNDEKLTDHHALIITENRPKDLSERDGRIYELVLTRFLEAFMPVCVADITKVTFSACGVEFSTRGRKDVSLGWRMVNKGGSFDDVELADVDQIEMSMRPLPEMKEGDVIDIASLQLIEDKTKPKPLLTDARLLSEMENAGKHSDDKSVAAALKDIGIGTPATRAAEIEIVMTRGYVLRIKKKLVPTELGMLVYNAVRDKSISSVDMTAKWETELGEIEDGKREAAEFHDGIRSYTKSIVKDFLSCKDFGKIQAVLGDYVLKCPSCGKEIRLGEKSAWCPSCKFTIWRDIAGKKLSDETMKKLIKNGRSGLVSGFRSKSGKTFSAYVLVDKDGRCSFEFENKK